MNYIPTDSQPERTPEPFGDASPESLQGAAQAIANIMADHLQSVRQLADGAGAR